MTKSNHDMVEDFARYGATDGHSCNIFAEGDILYDYGYHFPLLVRTPFGLVLNADKYSVTTSCHQGIAMQYAQLSIPFSALQAAGIITASDGDAMLRQFREVEVVDNTPQRWDIIGYHRYNSETEKTDHISVAQWERMTEEEQETWSQTEERRPESAVLHLHRETPNEEVTGYSKDGKTITPEEWAAMAQGEEPWQRWNWTAEKRQLPPTIKDAHYLSSMDGNNYFISELPHEVETVPEAFDSLRPLEVEGREYQRQGEWFFVPCQQLPLSIIVKHQTLSPQLIAKRIYKTMERNFVLPRTDESSNEHIATRGDIINGRIIVSGNIRHSEHGMLKLSKADNPRLFEAYRNLAVNSWSASGNVD